MMSKLTTILLALLFLGCNEKDKIDNSSSAIALIRISRYDDKGHRYDDKADFHTVFYDMDACPIFYRTFNKCNSNIKWEKAKQYD